QSTTTSAYDALNRPVEVIQGAWSAAARLTLSSYDAQDNRTYSATGLSGVAGGAAPHLVLSAFAYDGLNRQTGRTDLLEQPVNWFAVALAAPLNALLPAGVPLAQLNALLPGRLA